MLDVLVKLAHFRAEPRLEAVLCLLCILRPLCFQFLGSFGCVVDYIPLPGIKASLGLHFLNQIVHIELRHTIKVFLKSRPQLIQIEDEVTVVRPADYGLALVHENYLILLLF